MTVLVSSYTLCVKRNESDCYSLYNKFSAFICLGVSMITFLTSAGLAVYV